MNATSFFGAEAIRDAIIDALKSKQFIFEHSVHEPTPTSEDSARVRGTKLEEGVKSIILRGKTTSKNYLFNLPSHLKLDMKALAQIVGERCEFESPQLINERFGLIPGGVPPFGNLLGLETYFDEGIGTLLRSAFNCGMQTESIIMQSRDLIELVQPKFGKFGKT